MKKRLLLIAFIMIILCSVLYKYQHNQEGLQANSNNVVALNQSKDPFKSKSDQEYNIIEEKLTLAKIYKNVNELKNNSDLIIEGKTKGTRTVIYQSVEVTISEVEVYEVYKTYDESITRGSIVCIGENGGVLSKEYLIKMYKEKFGAVPKDAEKVKPAKVVPNGIAPMEPGDHVIIFAINAPGLTNGKCYFVIGAYQGKYNVYYDKVEHQVPKDLEEQFEDKVNSKNKLINLIKK